jgi:hypothetical protein
VALTGVVTLLRKSLKKTPSDTCGKAHPAFAEILNLRG